MSALTSPRTYAGLAAIQAASAIANAAQVPPIKKALDDVGLAEEMRPVLPVAMGASVVGLLAVRRFPALARLTTFMCTVYFVLAVAFHVKARDWTPNLVAAAAFAGLYGAMTAKGPDVRA